MRGTEASAVFTLGDETVRQFRYHDRGTLRYSFRLVNDGLLPVHVQRLIRPHPEPRLLHYLALVNSHGAKDFVVPAQGSAAVTLVLGMHGCERLSARAGSYAKPVTLATSAGGVFDHTLVIALPEHLHTGSPREAFCPRATATSRPPG